MVILPHNLSRFLRHVPVVYVDYPGPASLTQIYGTFNRAMLRLIPSLRTYAEPLTAAMVEFYTMSQVKMITFLLICMFYWRLFFSHINKNIEYYSFFHFRSASPRTHNPTTSTLPER